MHVKIKQFDTTLPLPEYKTAGAAGIDLYARIDTLVQPKTVGYIPLNVALEVPDGYWVLLSSRSSTHKQGLMPANGIGICDADYKGDNDEYHFPVYNFTDQSVTIERGQRIAQIIILPYERAELNLVKSLENVDRGKFGTTGTH